MLWKVQYKKERLDSRFHSLHIVQTVKRREISFSLSAVGLVSGVDGIRQPDVQSLVVLRQRGVMVVHDQILQRLVEVERLDEPEAALRVTNHAVPHLAADPVDQETRAGLGKLKPTLTSEKQPKKTNLKTETRNMMQCYTTNLRYFLLRFFYRPVLLILCLKSM